MRAHRIESAGLGEDEKRADPMPERDEPSEIPLGSNANGFTVRSAGASPYQILAHQNFRSIASSSRSETAELMEKERQIRLICLVSARYLTYYVP